jgi:hypothetical protein
LANEAPTDKRCPGPINHISSRDSRTTSETTFDATSDQAEEGFRRARQFLWREKVFSGYDLPYRTQLVPLAAILISLGSRWNDAAVRVRVRNWYWCGVFGELYGGAIESRFTRDLPQVVAWALGGETLP